jgi:hypothetical protein
MKAKKNKESQFIEGASLKGDKEPEYPDAISVRMTKDMAEAIRAIAYYERIPQREVIEQALELYLKEKDPNDIKEAFRVYNQKH